MLPTGPIQESRSNRCGAHPSQDPRTSNDPLQRLGTQYRLAVFEGELEMDRPSRSEKGLGPLARLGGDQPYAEERAAPRMTPGVEVFPSLRLTGAIGNDAHGVRIAVCGEDLAQSGVVHRTGRAIAHFHSGDDGA
jgi:hypothetical protein